MGLLSKLIDLIASGGTKREERGTPVAVEREPDTATERAVKEPEDPSSKPDSGPTEGSSDASTATSEPVETLSGIGPAYADRLGQAGIETVDDLAAADAETLAEETDIGAGRLAGWIEQARDR